jgi:hypothetical protein
MAAQISRVGRPLSRSPTRAAGMAGPRSRARP